MKAIALLITMITLSSAAYAAVECQVLYAPYPASPMTSPGVIRMQSLELNENKEAAVTLMGFNAKITAEQNLVGERFLTVQISKGASLAQNSQGLTAGTQTRLPLAVTTLVVGKDQVTVNCSQQ